jgi:hypothetical protein
MTLECAQTEPDHETYSYPADSKISKKNSGLNGSFGRCQARMALYAWGQSASSLAARGSFLLYFRELWQLMMTSKTCLG